MADSDVTVNLKPLFNLSREVEEGLRSPSANNPIRNAMKKWAVRVRSFLQERFDRFSKGGGDWKPLAKSTIARRRKARGKRKKKGGNSASILRDTGQLMNSLNPIFKNDPGAIERHTPFGVIIGFGGTSKHRGSKKTVAQIAKYHQVGGGRLPQRKIIVEPDERVVGQMKDDMVMALKEI